MLSGHVCRLADMALAGEGRRQDSFAGHTVHSLLSDFQCHPNGGDGWLRIMRFVPSANEIRVRTFSPTLNQFEVDDSSDFTISTPMGGVAFSQIAQFTNVTNATGVHLTTQWPNLASGRRLRVVRDRERRWPDDTRTDLALHDALTGGVCNSAQACEDGNPCTTDRCVTNACVHDVNTASCNDNNACTLTDVCQGGVCIGSNPKVCPASDSCHTGTCTPSTGACGQATKANGSACNDNNACTGGEFCTAGVCGGGWDAGLPGRYGHRGRDRPPGQPDHQLRHPEPVELDGDSNAVQRAYFRVHVDSPGGQPITNAQLRLHVTDTSGSNSSSGGAIHSTLCEWSDSTLTWNTQATPAFDAATLSTVGTAARNAFVNFNVSSAITNGGDHCFVIEPGSTDNVRYDSIEFATAASKPQVLLTSQCACGTPPPTTTPARSSRRPRRRSPPPPLPRRPPPPRPPCRPAHRASRCG
jgi:hypothetical protein